MRTKAYSQTSRDRQVAAFFIAIPVAVLLGVIRYFQSPKHVLNDGDDGDPARPL